MRPPSDIRDKGEITIDREEEEEGERLWAVLRRQFIWVKLLEMLVWIRASNVKLETLATVLFFMWLETSVKVAEGRGVGKPGNADLSCQH